MCVVRRMFGAQVCSVVRRLFGCGLVVLLVVLIVPLFLSFLAMPGLCCFLRATHIYPRFMPFVAMPGLYCFLCVTHSPMPRLFVQCNIAL